MQSLALSPFDASDSFVSRFARGWTLQELRAPRDLVFLDERWIAFGRKRAMIDRISDITGIHTRYLAHGPRFYPLPRASVATRMSWASRRTTSRTEDMAYCLLGLFDINMPLLYGEGAKAFIRLQQAIIEISNDEYIFCWTEKNPSGGRENRSMFAASPRQFKHSADFNPIGLKKGCHKKGLPLREPFFSTHQGLHFKGGVLPIPWNLNMLMGHKDPTSTPGVCLVPLRVCHSDGTVRFHGGLEGPFIAITFWFKGLEGQAYRLAGAPLVK